MIKLRLYKHPFDSESDRTYAFKDQEEEFQVIQKMLQYGGSFVVQLAKLYEMADGFNKLKLVNAFDYFDQYQKFKNEEQEGGQVGS